MAEDTPIAIVSYLVPLTNWYW